MLTFRKDAEKLLSEKLLAIEKVAQNHKICSKVAEQNMSWLTLRPVVETGTGEFQAGVNPAMD